MTKRRRWRGGGGAGGRGVLAAAASGEGESSAASVAEPSALNVTALGSNTRLHLSSSSRLPSAASVWEPLQARLNHGLPLPVGVTPDDVARIRKAAEVRYVTAANAEGAALAGGRLLRELAEESSDATVADERRREPEALRVLGARQQHPRAARRARRVPRRVASGGVDGARRDLARGPTTRRRARRESGGRTGRADRLERSRFASGRRSAGAKRSRAMVRVLFNGAVLPLAGCAGQEDKKERGLCSLAAFRDMARRRDPEDYRKACEAVSARL